MTNDPREKEFLAWLESQFGWEGFGRWYKLLEKVGEIMGGANGCSAALSWADWQTSLNRKRNKMEPFLVWLKDKEKRKYR